MEGFGMRIANRAGLVIVLAAAAAILVGCRGAGALVGAGVGAVAGQTAGRNTASTVAGAAAGAVVGATIENTYYGSTSDMGQ
jgi:uncharacterized protein YcfJ